MNLVINTCTMKTTKDTVNSRLMLLKNTLNLGQNEFCFRADISSATLHSIQNGAELRPRTVKKIADAFGANFNWLQTGEGEMLLSKNELTTNPNDPWRDALVQQVKEENTRLTNELNRVWAMVNHLTGGKIPNFHNATIEAGLLAQYLPGASFNKPLVA